MDGRTHVCTQSRTHAHIHTPTHAPTHPQTHTRTYGWTHAHTHEYTHGRKYACTHERTYGWTHTLTHTIRHRHTLTLELPYRTAHSLIFFLIFLLLLVYSVWICSVMRTCVFLFLDLYLQCIEKLCSSFFTVILLILSLLNFYRGPVFLFLNFHKNLN